MAYYAAAVDATVQLNFADKNLVEEMSYCLLACFFSSLSFTGHIVKFDGKKKKNGGELFKNSIVANVVYFTQPRSFTQHDRFLLGLIGKALLLLVYTDTIAPTCNT